MMCDVGAGAAGLRASTPVMMRQDRRPWAVTGCRMTSTPFAPTALSQMLHTANTPQTRPSTGAFGVQEAFFFVCW